MTAETSSKPATAPIAKPRLTPEEASVYLQAEHGLKLAVRTLQKLRVEGGGPPFHRYNRNVLYPRAELDVWVVKKLGALVHSTSDDGDRP